MTTLKNIAVAVASVVLFSNITSAQAVKASYSVNYEEPMAVKYIGSDADYLTFQVSVKPGANSNVVFEIEDQYEGELYAANLATNFNAKTIKIERRDGQVLRFKLVVGKTVYTKSFSVNSNMVETTKVVENSITML